MPHTHITTWIQETDCMIWHIRFCTPSPIPPDKPRCPSYTNPNPNPNSNPSSLSIFLSRYHCIYAFMIHLHCTSVSCSVALYHTQMDAAEFTVHFFYGTAFYWQYSIEIISTVRNQWSHAGIRLSCDDLIVITDD